MPEHDKVVAVISIEPVTGAKPHIALVVLHDAGNDVLGKPVGDGQAFESQGWIFLEFRCVGSG